MKIIAQHKNLQAKHQYEIEVNTERHIVVIDADTRAQAAKIAREHGYEVRSVNMVG